MDKQYRKGAVGGLLDEYEKVINELKTVIENVSPSQLITIVDNDTTDPCCRSIQTVLTHVVSSGYSYAVYIRHLKQSEGKRPDEILRLHSADYQKELDAVFEYTCNTFDRIKDDELEEFDNEKKIHTSWGQQYDIEQMMEHAIVHVLRHRRQIERFLNGL